MFRSMSEDRGGFVNLGLETSDEDGKVESSRPYAPSDISSTKIEITRAKYDQQKLNDEMMYKKPPSKSGEFFPRFNRTASLALKIKCNARKL